MHANDDSIILFEPFGLQVAIISSRLVLPMSGPDDSFVLELVLLLLCIELPRAEYISSRRVHNRYAAW